MKERDPYEREKSLGWNAHRAGDPITANPFQRPVIDSPNNLSIAWAIGWREREAHMQALNEVQRTATMIAGEDLEIGDVVSVRHGKAWRA